MATAEETQAPEAQPTEAQPTETPPRVGKQLALFEGKRYPNVDLRMAGGVVGDAEYLMPDLTGQKIGSAFTLTVHGVVTAKKHALTFDKDGEEVRTLVVTLKVDSIDQPDDA